VSAGELRIEWMRLGEIREAERNSKLHDLDELDTAARALGWTSELRYDERTQRLIRGHGRRRYLVRERDRGAEPPEGIRVAADGEWLVPVVRGWASRDDHHAAAAKIADNDVGKKRGHDPALLLDELADLAAEAPELLAATTHNSDAIDRLMTEASVTELPTVLLPDDSDRPARKRERDDEQWETGASPDEGSTREPEGPGPLDVEPAWRTIEPLRARYHDGTPDGADAVARWLHSHATDVHVGPDLSITWRGGDGTDYLPPGKWVTRYRGRFDVLTRDEFHDEFVAANEPARRADRDARPITRGAAVLRHGSGVL
jgi:hypothetical protein